MQLAYVAIFTLSTPAAIESSSSSSKSPFPANPLSHNCLPVSFFSSFAAGFFAFLSSASFSSLFRCSSSSNSFWNRACHSRNDWTVTAVPWNLRFSSSSAFTASISFSAWMALARSAIRSSAPSFKALTSVKTIAIPIFSSMVGCSTSKSLSRSSWMSNRGCFGALCGVDISSSGATSGYSGGYET